MLPNLSGLAVGRTGTLYDNIQEARKERNDPKFGEGQDCPMCIQPLEGDQKIVVSNCRHAFHEECAKSWFERNNKCAMCRNPMQAAELGKPTPPPSTPEWDKYIMDKRLEVAMRTTRTTPYNDEGNLSFTMYQPRVAWTRFFPRKGYPVGFEQAQIVPGVPPMTGWENDSLRRDSPVGPKAKLRSFAYVMFTMPPIVDLQFYQHGVGFGKEEYWTRMIQRVEGVIDFMMDLIEDMERRDAFDEYQQALFRWLSITELAVARTLVMREIWDRDIKPMLAGLLPEFTDATARAEMQYGCNPWDFCSVYYLIETELDEIAWILSYSRIEPAGEEGPRRENYRFTVERPRISRIRDGIRQFVRDTANRAEVDVDDRLLNNEMAIARERQNILSRAWDRGRQAGFRMGYFRTRFFMEGLDREPEGPLHAPSREEAAEAVRDIDDVKNAYRKRLTTIDGEVPDEAEKKAAREAELQEFFKYVLLPGEEPAPRRSTTYFTPMPSRRRR